jgi:hypothetical protein
LLAFPGVFKGFPADAALGLSPRIIGEKNTAVNRIFGQARRAKRDILTNPDPETIHFSRGQVEPSRLCFDRKACVAQPSCLLDKFLLTNGLPTARTTAEERGTAHWL